ncbi:ABC transporter B family member 29, chloroplastic isoform X2 [Salvia divinorum]|uniref:ABC transporter B family member 29, chloroplastic isoform X2 n=1 Tax=Salvia divinorum TaxID=28513 RepID=A0ABD1GYS6_SALDI
MKSERLLVPSPNRIFGRFKAGLQRDLGFFEGRNRILFGDVAYRITAEAEDVTDTVHSLLNTIVPSVLQLQAMATQMLTVSPQLSLLSTFVIPAMGLTVGCLDEKLSIISNDTNLSPPSLATYLNEVPFFLTLT